MKVVRKLSKSERERNFIYIERYYRKIFPRDKEKFILRFEDKEFSVEIDPMSRIWCGRFIKKINLMNAIKVEIEESPTPNSFLLKIKQHDANTSEYNPQFTYKVQDKK